MKRYFDKNDIDSINLQKILKSKKSRELKFIYKGKNKNGKPHTEKDFGIKNFEDDTDLQSKIASLNYKIQYGYPTDKDIEEKNKLMKKKRAPDYDIELLKNYIKGTYTQEFFYSLGPRASEKAQYKNGVPHGAAYLGLGLAGVEYYHDLYCTFDNGIIDGDCFYYYRFQHELIRFKKGEIITHISFDNLTDKQLSSLLDSWKNNQYLYELMKDDLELYE